MTRFWGILCAVVIGSAPVARAQQGERDEGAEEAAPAATPEPVDVAARYARPVEHFTLENGLEVFLQPDERASQVATCTSYQVGSRDDPEGYRGLAHLLEHMAFRGSDNAPDGYLMMLDDAGASSYNGTTSDDRTSYYAVVPPSRVEVPLWIEADRMAYLLTGIDEEELGDEQEIVVHEWRERGGGSSWAEMRKTLWEELYPVGHPYRDTVNRPDDVRAISLSDIRWHFQRWYQPNNARLAVVGRFDGPTVRRRVEEWFGPIRLQRSDPLERRTAGPVELTGETIIHMEGSVGRSRVIISWPTPPFLAEGDAELDLVAGILAGDRNRGLEKLLVKSEIANSVSARQSSSELGSTFTIEASGNVDRTAAEMLSIIDRELARVRTELAREADVREEIEDWQNAWLGSVDSIGSRACRLAQYRPPDGRFYDLAYNYRRYEGITPEDVRAAARRYLLPDRRVIVMVENDNDAGELEIDRIERRVASGRSGE